MSTDQVTFTEDELLADHDGIEPLVVGDVRCHGGFDESGTYVSPRTLHRAPAIEAWEAQRAAQFGTEPLHAPLDTWPEHFPNVAQTKLLLRNGVRTPMITELTRIGTVEGFGAMMRYLPMPDVRSIFVEDIEGTATDHIRKGLFEAHSRDEAGWEDVAGHDRMWYMTRDLAFENPVTEDQTQVMLQRMGIIPPDGPPDISAIMERMQGMRVLPNDLPGELEMMLGRMISLLFIEISAFHVFAWAEEVLDDRDLVASDGEAARLVSYIRQDETPHVGYLTVSLSEMRDRTWKGATGATYDGNEMIETIWDRMLADSLLARRGDFLRSTIAEIRHALEGNPNADDILEEMWSLGVLKPLDDGGFVEQRRDGSEVHIPAAAA